MLKAVPLTHLLIFVILTSILYQPLQTVRITALRTILRTTDAQEDTVYKVIVTTTGVTMISSVTSQTMIMFVTQITLETF